ncbi:MAG: group 1 truncated hemoglobin [Pirellulaceae bacterium]
MSDSEKDLFSRLGGADGITAVVKEMYRNVLADPDLSAFFEGVSQERLHMMQFQFLASAFGGPIEYTGSELTQIHAKHAITGRHFSRFCNHFAEAMESSGADPRDVDDALGKLAMFKDKITGESNVDG